MSPSDSKDIEALYPNSNVELTKKKAKEAFKRSKTTISSVIKLKLCNYLSVLSKGVLLPRKLHQYLRHVHRIITMVRRRNSRGYLTSILTVWLDQNIKITCNIQENREHGGMPVLDLECWRKRSCRDFTRKATLAHMYVTLFREIWLRHHIDVCARANLYDPC